MTSANDHVVLLSKRKTAQWNLFSILEKIDLAGKGLLRDDAKKIMALQKKCIVSMLHSVFTCLWSSRPSEKHVKPRHLETNH